MEGVVNMKAKGSEGNPTLYALDRRSSGYKRLTQRDVVLLLVLHLPFYELIGIECPVWHSDLPKLWIVVISGKPWLDEVIEDFEQGRGAA